MGFSVAFFRGGEGDEAAVPLEVPSRRQKSWKEENVGGPQELGPVATACLNQEAPTPGDQRVVGS